ncbi:MAG TPA: hypothetical protein VGF39_16520 [Stellaceae bacterium]
MPAVAGETPVLGRWAVADPPEVTEAKMLGMVDPSNRRALAGVLKDDGQRGRAGRRRVEVGIDEEIAVDPEAETEDRAHAVPPHGVEQSRWREARPVRQSGP